MRDNRPGRGSHSRLPKTGICHFATLQVLNTSDSYVFILHRFVNDLLSAAAICVHLATCQNLLTLCKNTFHPEKNL